MLYAKWDFAVHASVQRFPRSRRPQNAKTDMPDIVQCMATRMRHCSVL